jgi:hypothetical protein
MIHHAGDLQQAVRELAASKAFEDLVLVQELVGGPLERAQAVFCQGRLVGTHGYRQVVLGAGGGDAVKESVRRPVVQSHLGRLGERLGWHGALSVDYILQEKEGLPLYIDCNPRLVEPVNALLSGVHLADLLVRVSLGESPSVATEGREGTRTHMAIQALLASAIRQRSRRELLRECWRLLLAHRPYADSHEELTPVRWDWVSSIPLAVVALGLLRDPGTARHLARSTARSHQLNLESVRTIREWIGPPTSAVQAPPT